MILKPTQYAHSNFIVNIRHRKNKNYTLDIQIDFFRENRKLIRRGYKVSRDTIHYSLYRNVDFELVKRVYAFTDIYYSIFINQ